MPTYEKVGGEGEQEPKRSAVETSVYCERLRRACESRLTRDSGSFALHTIGFGHDSSEFGVLKAMAASLPDGVGHSHHSVLSGVELKRVVLRSSVSLTESRVASSMAARRPLRPVEFRQIELTQGTGSWLQYDDISLWQSSASVDEECREVVEVSVLQGSWSICISQAAFDAGGERNVFSATFALGTMQGGMADATWVAKENKHIERGGWHAELSFHHKSLVTQATARALAQQFNIAVQTALASSSTPAVELPPVEFGTCFLAIAHGRPLFLEPRLQGRFQKWNSNCGAVHYIEGEEEAVDSDGVAAAVHVPQAFTHWTHHASGGRRMVCDLQGVFTGEVYQLVDPVIHSVGDGGHRTGKFSRTDRGSHGVVDFFRSHTCGPLCALLGIPPHTAADPAVASATDAERECVICEDAPRQVRFLCGHACCCEGCAELVRTASNVCPQCRAPLGLTPFTAIRGAAITFVP